MNNLNRLGHGCMSMSKARNYQSSVQTIHTALDAGITLLNTGYFYQQSAVSAAEIQLTPTNIAKIEAAVPAKLSKEIDMRNYVFTNGKMSLVK